MEPPCTSFHPENGLKVGLPLIHPEFCKWLIQYLLFGIFIFAPFITHAAKPNSGMVVAAQKEAAQAGIQMLRQGGNAFDAAAATALALGVVEPGSNGIGGGGFFLLYIAKEERYVMLDARETSPKLAGHSEVYRTKSSIDGPQSAGVPGLVAGVDRLVSRYGKLTRTDVTMPAIHLARQGFTVSPRLKRMLDWRGKVFNDTARRIFLKKEGEVIRQPALADTLARFAARGAADFYRGETAGRLVADMKRDGGLIRTADLASYKAIERKPVMFDFQGFHFVSASLPSSGGMTLAEIFGMLKNDNLKAMASADRAHLLIEAMKRAYRDRNQYLGDADFVSIPKDYLGPKRLQRLRASIRMNRATPSSELGHIAEPSGDAANTTHFSIIDREGNMVAATLSINYGFGSGYVSPSTGILLNDEMDDFATRPGKPNAYGLVQGKANAVAPGKRMLSSMTPTFVIGPKRTFIVGTPGGSRIISMVLLASIDFMLDETPPADWVNAPRFHHQFLPDAVQHEQDAFKPEVAAELTKRGHHLKQIHNYGNMQAILWNRPTGVLVGISDSRGKGKALVLSK
ncbi:MAG: gamma-glutamyltransferase [Mariprofundaceae bacterium]|nr:gamma-glutamyltransferase [Mariprofundaceae bacterium]